MNDLTYRYYLLNGVVHFTDGISQLSQGYFTCSASETNNKQFLYYGL
jgi:hypothetical protein